jgi:amino-acid N-acetyltransferase
MPPTVRRATAADASRIEALIERYVPSGTLLPRAASFIRDHADDYLVAVDGTRILGCVHLDDYAPSLAEIRSLAVDPAVQAGGVGKTLVAAAEALARVREYTTLFAVSNTGAFFLARGYEPRHIPELDRERSEVSRFKGVYAKDLAPASPGA